MTWGHYVFDLSKGISISSPGDKRQVSHLLELELSDNGWNLKNPRGNEDDPNFSSSDDAKGVLFHLNQEWIHYPSYLGWGFANIYNNRNNLSEEEIQSRLNDLAQWVIDCHETLKSGCPKWFI